MPRFGTKALLIGFAVAAAWLSTFSGYRPAQDVRRSILLLILIASGLAAVYSRERRRAFWSAFFAVMLLCSGLSFNGSLLYRYVPDFMWLEFSSADMQANQTVSPYMPTPAPTTPATPATSPPPASSVDLFGAPASPPTITTPRPMYNYVQQAPAYQSPWTVRQGLDDTIAASWTIGLSLIAAFLAAYMCTSK